jgi:lipopolysaccharide transport system ATP-binding protein
VKRYSSGMRVRLAFAVAAHLEPEVLLVDEVLAVGDIAFQKKCLGKMGDVVGEGRTVLFVSHNMAAVKALCHRGMYLDSGRLEYCGSVEACVRMYLKTGVNGDLPMVQVPLEERLPAQVASLAVLNEARQPALELLHDRPFVVQIQVLVRSRLSNTYVALQIHDQELVTLLLSRDFEGDESRLSTREPGLYTYHLPVPGSLLVPGEYLLSAHVAQSSPRRLVDISGPGRMVHRVDHACSFELIDNGSAQARLGLPWGGKLSVPLQWEEVEVKSDVGSVQG